MKSAKIANVMLACVVAVGVLAGAAPAQAADTEGAVSQFNTEAEQALKTQLDAAVDTNGLEASFGDISIDAGPDVVALYDGDADAYAADIMEAFKSDAPTQEPNRVTPFANYTSSVFAGVPAGGACWIKQDFSATVSNYKVTSKSLRGSSYQEGVCVFQWSPNYSWFEGSFNVLSKGTFHAIIKGGPVSFAATFKAIYTVNKSSLTQHVQ
ncbi:hypothetical protein [Microbacterium sp. JZ37]|uniref:hypothetical protein n=1 Tax=Microbacterium sp. JZ37 TaxID=2654193 RepID=UPI002B46C525|nr:hypothetical protein [Microbacterium sp. JZ37]WRH17929.1 3,4-dihydroxy-2-butanone 4-phosphate synthase [Microbacterium sp. JZ37]